MHQVVARIEHRDTRLGPYRHSYWLTPRLDGALAVLGRRQLEPDLDDILSTSNWRRRPPPSSEAGPGSVVSGHHIFGFSEVGQLARWFPRHIRRLLPIEFGVALYVVDKRLLRVTSTQAWWSREEGVLLRQLDAARALRIQEIAGAWRALSEESSETRFNNMFRQMARVQQMEFMQCPDR